MRLASSHPEIKIAWATGETSAGQSIADAIPALAAEYGSDVFLSFERHLLDDVDLVVLALPHGASQSLVPQLVDPNAGRTVKWIVDLAADFRHHDPAIYPTWYGEPHACPELLETFVYGLPELYREQLRAATRVAAPGCYPTSASLVLAPLVRAGVIDPSHVIVDAACGVSGAGKPPKASTTFNAVADNLTAYGLLDHRHTPEMETHTGATVLFTPHLAPMNRGILSTCYGRALGDHTTESALEVLIDAYADEPFVVVSERSPQTKSCQGSNTAHLTVRVDQRTRTVVAISAIDNLVKGTAGQAIQCVNLMVGLAETTGLPRVGMTP